ncbi:hypothetical protein FIV42_19055 [Persicimonas caeni]|uniref:Peptidase C-terminal archaeal/bacterial domain-containing protein n=1 Tax=Persicimonas caeni TaxID=2292766 RepID=A0A4Y6PWR1_PERCE|nr:hypothetical protein [Persicimonas caeni]QDG52764.1 hypothetical protein FIV42_19055 [Persicimonas caeni]QED33986.1 hypothetical protein FRD00_19050 [Persicimonas caeni]
MRAVVHQWKRLATILMLAGMLMPFLSGCGGEEDACADVECDFGVCQDGACRNPSTCQSDLECLPGYSCGDQSVCKALTACEANSDCDSGWCRNGACANPETCETNDDCFERTYCAEDGTCQPDPCNEFECTTGQCARGTKTCESKETCTLETESEDCIDGEQCLDGSCYAPDAYCEALACDKGVCSFEERACVNADDCKGDSANCTEGYYCNDANECVDDLCVVNDVECTDGGVCMPSLGECQNASTCTTSDECLGGHVCVEGECRLEELACGDDGCPGNQLCTYDADELTATCGENPNVACTTSLDCTDGRQCAGDACVAPFSCNQDDFESNDTAAEATDLNAVATGISARGSICSGDVDFYTVDLSQYSGLPIRGRLMITAEYAQRDIGLGELVMTVTDPQGNVVGTDTGGLMGRDGILQVTASLNAVSPRQYTIEIAEADGGDLSSAGVEYTVSADLLETKSLEACNDATPLTAGTPVRGDTRQALGYHLGSSCTSIHNGAREDIYSFEITTPSNVQLNVIPDTDFNSVDWTISIRRACERLETEVACVDASEQGGEIVNRLLGPGTYYAIVQTSSGSETGGEYRLTFNATPTTCAPSSNACTDTNTANICNDAGSQLVTTACNLGCDPRTGTCLRRDGDLCVDPIFVSGGDTETINWGDFQNDYQINLGACLDNDARAHTSGPDAVYAVNLQPNEGVQATVEFADGDAGAVYIVTSCASAENSCVGGGNDDLGSTESASYLNETDGTQTVFIVADTESSTNLAQATLTVETGQKVCQPRTTRCTASEDVEICNDVGIAYQPSESCDFGCTGGQCNEPPNQTCEGAIALTSGQPVTQRIKGYANSFEYDPSSDGCTGDAEDGPDAVYSLTTTQANQMVDVYVDAPWDVSVTVAAGCFKDQMQCLKAVDTTSQAETLSFAAREAGDYYIIVDTDEASPTGSFTITATERTPSCTPGEVIGCNASSLEYCDEGGNSRTVTCATSCTNGACDGADAETCEQAVLMGHGDSVTDTLSGSDDLELPDRRFGGCALDSYDYTDGNDHFYRVNLAAGDLLQANLQTSSSSVYAFIVESCFLAEETCVTNNPSGGTATLSHYAETAQSVYIVVDSSSTSSSQYTLSVDVTQGKVCAPGETICTGPNTVQSCNSDGTAIVGEYTCLGGCYAGGCFPDLAASNSCATAPNIGDGIAVYADFGDLTNDVEISSSGCTGDTGDGNDLIYEMDLLAGELVNARVEAYGNEEPMVYIVTDCADPTNTCLSGADEGPGDIAETRYQATTDETVYIVADSDYSGDDEAFALFVDKLQPECDSQSQNTCLDPSTARYCDTGLWTVTTCGAGCSNGGCTGEDCSAPADVTNDARLSGGTVISGVWGDYTNDISGSGCGLTSTHTNGEDVVLTATLMAGQTITATVTNPDDPSTWYGDPGVVITSSCGTISSSTCLAADEGEDAPATTSYTATTTETVFIIADHDDTTTSSTSERFDISVSIQ